MSSAAARLATRGGNCCPACGGVVVPAIDAGPFHLYGCTACGSWSSDALVRQAPLSFTPANYFANADADRDRWEALLDRLPRPPTAVLDVGCGTGAFLGYLGRRFPAARRAGVELDEARAEEARRRNPAATILAGDAVAVATAAGIRFDLITLWDVFEHVPDPAALLRSLLPLLAPGGIIFIQTIHEASLVPTLGRWSYQWTGGRVRSLVRRTHDAHHLVFFTRDGLRRLAGGAGLVIRECWFDRLDLARMDGNRWLAAATATVLALENALGNGLFVNVILAADGDAGPAPRPGS